MALLSKKIGIDLGTTNILVYLPGKGVILNEPSVVAVSVADNSILAFGIEAKRMIGRTHDDIRAFYPMKDGVIADYRVAEKMLNYYFKRALGKLSFIKPDVLLSVPAGISSTERRAVIEAALRAGAKNAYVVKEPILAAIGSGISIQEPNGYMIVDIGGGTIDVAVISLGGIVASNSVKVAGQKLNQSIIEWMKKQHNLAIGERTAEKIKIKIGSAISLEDELQVIVKGRDYVTGLPRSVKISTNEVTKAIDGDLKRMIRAMKDVLAKVPPELASDIIDNGIALTGGTSQLRNLPELIKRRTGVEAHLVDDPLLCVARGTGIALEHIDTYKKAIITK